MPRTLRSSSTIACLTFAAATSLATSSQAQQFVDQTATRLPPGLSEYTNQASVCDVDGDNDLDIALAQGGGFPAAGADQQVRLFINNGSGVFTDESIARVGVLLGDFRGVEFGDVDRDGDWDMVLANDNNQLPRLLINNGLGVFANETATRLPNLTLGSSRAQFGDVDNDGDLDLYFTNGTTNRFGTGRGKLYLNDGTGVFTDFTNTNTPVQNVSEPQDCIFGDIDGDFDLDLRIGSTASNQSKLYFNNGAGVFTAPAVAPPADANCYSYDFGDINGDGDFDLLGANASNTVANGELLLSNDGAGTYAVNAPQINPNPGADDNDSKFLDWDNDGDMDLIIAALGQASEKFYLNNGTGTFTQVAGMITAFSDSSLDIKVADFNGDGRYDLYTAQGESGSFIDRIYMNLTGPVDNRPPSIVRTEQLPNTAIAGPYVVRVVAYDAHTSDRGFHDKGVTLQWRRGGKGAFNAVDMKWSGNSVWRGVIPTQPESGLIEYYVEARDFANNLATGPTQSFTLTLPTPCLGDVNNDGNVNVADLLSVITNWGAVGANPADVTGDLVVNVADLLAVITAWGPCP